MNAITQASASTGAAGASVAQRAKNALRRLAVDKLEPTPENYAIAYRMESGGARPPALPAEALALVQRVAARAMGDDGGPRAANFCKALAEAHWERAETLFADAAPDGRQLATLFDRVVKGMERGGRQWTLARKKDSLQRVLDGSRSDARRLQQRLAQLLGRWEADTPDEAVEAVQAVHAVEAVKAVEAVHAALLAEPIEAAAADGDTHAHAHMHVRFPTQSKAAAMALAADTGEVARPTPTTTDGTRAFATALALDTLQEQAWDRLLTPVLAALIDALPPNEVSGRRMAAQLAALAQSLRTEGVNAERVDAAAALCDGVRRLLQHRHHLVDQLGALCHELTASLSELAEDDSWARGQCDAMRITLEDGITARGVKSVSELLRNTRQRQSQMRQERDRARDALKALINRMLGELGELGSQTGRFSDSVGRYAEVIEQSESLETLAGVVREMVEESHSVQALVSTARDRLNDEHSKASGLSERVIALEGELNRLSSEVSTDQLTQVANRRGMLRDFELARARADRHGESLAVGLLDIDNFKRLNDELGHNAGDAALKSLATLVKTSLRPADSVARYGGEEFVVLLPDTPVAEAQAILTRLQRTLSSGLFMHEQKNVMVTFSAGVTTYRKGERIEDTLERADQSLFEAKRKGKNRTCAS